MTVPTPGWLLLAVLGAFALLGASLWAARRRAKQLERLLEGAREKLEQLQFQFERFVPAEVVERLTEGRGAYTAERRQITMLFADLRGFTSLCDKLDPAVTCLLYTSDAADE